MKKTLAVLAVALLGLATSAGIAFAHGGNSGSGGGGGDDRVRIEVRAGEDEPGENRVRVEVRGDGSVEDAMSLLNGLNIPADGRVRVETREDGNRVRIEVRGAEEVEEDLPKFEIEGNTFEITGEVTAFTGGTVTVAGRTITINPGAVANFEQEGTIEVGEVIKVEGVIEADGTLLAREIKANGVEVETNVTGGSLSSLLSQIIAFLQSLM